MAQIKQWTNFSTKYILNISVYQKKNVFKEIVFGRQRIRMELNTSQLLQKYSLNSQTKCAVIFNSDTSVLITIPN